LPIEIPLVDLWATHEALAPEVMAGLAGVIAESDFIRGTAVGAFENDYAAYCGVGHCVGVANGTDAVELGLRALGVERDDTVVVPAFTFAATALAVLRIGAQPVFCDVDPDTLLIDPDRARQAVDASTAAVVAVDLYGQCAPVEQLREWWPGPVLVDGAQSHGARRRGRRAGGLGEATSTSFYPSKNLGAMGDGGAVLTDSGRVAAAVRAMGNYGSEVRYRHSRAGWNSRLDSVQAAVLAVKLEHLDHWNAQRVEAARRYDGLLPRPAVATARGNDHVRHLYVIRVDHRDAVLRALNDAGIGAAVHYPQALTEIPAFAPYVTRACPVAEGAAAEVLSLPLWPGITPHQQGLVCTAVSSALGTKEAVS
jgi:dTDP-4-amino-4,6-dideoxygalactose transaminase